MNKEEFAGELIGLFPEKKSALEEHYNLYEDLFGHIFFLEEVANSLVSLLQENNNMQAISIYCKFIEKMWKMGDSDVDNIVAVTILERLSDDVIIWQRFGEHLTEPFKKYVNTNILQNNIMMWDCEKLQ